MRQYVAYHLRCSHRLDRSGHEDVLVVVCASQENESRTSILRPRCQLHHLSLLQCHVSPLIIFVNLNSLKNLSFITNNSTSFNSYMLSGKPRPGPS